MLNAARIFLKVVEQGSFSKAATVLNMAPSSVTRAVDGLEQELGVTLFARSTRQIKLTESGQRFLADVRPWVAKADELKYSLLRQQGPLSGRLSVSVFEAFGIQQLAPKLADFIAQYPHIELQLAHDNRMVDLLEEGVDVAIRIGRPTDSGLKALRLMDNHTHVLAAPQYWQRHGMPERPEDVSDHNCLLLSRGRQLSYWHFRRQQQHVRVAVNGNLSSRGGMPLLAAAIAGAGVVQLSHWVSAEAVENGLLQPCLPDWQASLQAAGSGQVYAVYLATSHPNPLVRAFIDFLKQAFCHG